MDPRIMVSGPESDELSCITSAIESMKQGGGERRMSGMAKEKDCLTEGEGEARLTDRRMEGD